MELEDVRFHRRFARAAIKRIMERSLDRVTPRCPHYDGDACGGCQLQHLTVTAQLAAKRAIVGDALRRLGGLDLSDPEIVPSDTVWEYRTRLTLTRCRRTRRIGLHRFDRPDEVFDLQYCYITSRDLNRLWRAIDERRELLPADTERVVLRLDRTGGAHLIVETSASIVWQQAERLREVILERGVSATVWWQPHGGAARVLAGPPVAGRAETPFPAAVFEQIHPGFGDVIRAHAVEQLGDVRDRHVWDLYAGTGDTTARLLEAGASVESVESDRRAVDVACERAPGGPVERHAERCEAIVGRLRPPHLVITNPPRVGMHQDVVRWIVHHRPERVVYVSCDPATLARDIRRLGPTYRLRVLRAFDLFPQTAHVETVATLEVA